MFYKYMPNSGVILINAITLDDSFLHELILIHRLIIIIMIIMIGYMCVCVFFDNKILVSFEFSNPRDSNIFQIW